MRTFHFIFATLLVFAACTKEDYGSPNVKDTTNVTSTTDSLKWNLYVKIPMLGIEETNIKPFLIHNLMGWDDSTNTEVQTGYFVQFYDSRGNLFEFAYDFKTRSITHGGGRLMTPTEHTYILNVSTNTINICNSYQNVPFIYNVFTPTIINH
jgi:hypothetical protein